MLYKERAHILSIIRRRLAGKKKFFRWDGVKKRIHHVVKLLHWWNNDRVAYFLVDADAEIGNKNHTTEVSDT